MTGWTPIRTDADIADLLEQYACFLDSCLVRAHFVTGDFDDGTGMVIGAPEDKQLRLFFHSQCVDKPLELWFSGVRQCQLPGWQDHYSNEISGCCLEIRRDLMLPRRDDPLIVWADNTGFDPRASIEILHEPMTAFVIASDLKWRFAEE